MITLYYILAIISAMGGLAVTFMKIGQWLENRLLKVLDKHVVTEITNEINKAIQPINEELKPEDGPSLKERVIALNVWQQDTTGHLNEQDEQLEHINDRVDKLLDREK